MNFMKLATCTHASKGGSTATGMDACMDDKLVGPYQIAIHPITLHNLPTNSGIVQILRPIESEPRPWPTDLRHLEKLESIGI